MKVYKPFYPNDNKNNNYYFYRHNIKYQYVLKELYQLQLNQKKYFELNQVPLYVSKSITDIYENFNEKMDICWENCMDILYN